MSISRELLAPLDDVWAFVAEPHNFAKWWPRVGGVMPDRRGRAPGARWQIRGENRPSFLRRPEAVGHLLVLAVEPKRRFGFQLSGDRLDVDLTLQPTGEDRTQATLRVQGPWLVGLSRALPREALLRLHALCQTGAA